VLRARVRAAPHDGEANEALCALLAKTFGVPVGRLRVLTGATSRIKTIGVAGDATALTKALEALEGRPAA
jgi:uncharacterized protein YggU (UPF0235/DUF167 family)